MKTVCKSGFTLIELTIVVCIIAFLSTMAVAVYSQITESQYDTEGIACVKDLHAQALRLISDHGVSNSATHESREIHPGCVEISQNGSGGVRLVESNSANFAKYISTSLIESAQVHWKYHVCICIDEPGKDTNDGNVEAFNVYAFEDIPGEDVGRAIVSGSGTDTPIIFEVNEGSKKDDKTGTSGGTADAPKASGGKDLKSIVDGFICKPDISGGSGGSGGGSGSG